MVLPTPRLWIKSLKTSVTEQPKKIQICILSASVVPPTQLPPRDITLFVKSILRNSCIFLALFSRMPQHLAAAHKPQIGCLAAERIFKFLFSLRGMATIQIYTNLLCRGFRFPDSRFTFVHFQSILQQRCTSCLHVDFLAQILNTCLKLCSRQAPVRTPHGP